MENHKMVFHLYYLELLTFNISYTVNLVGKLAPTAKEAKNTAENRAFSIWFANC